MLRGQHLPPLAPWALARKNVSVERFLSRKVRGKNA